jgi:DNA (cytosine-5)-methyltransferase 1
MSTINKRRDDEDSLPFPPISQQPLNGSQKEIYQFTPSRQYVSRQVSLGDKNIHSSKLYLGKSLNYSVEGDDAHSAFDRAYLRNRRKIGLEAVSSVVYGVDLFSGCGGLSLGIQEACLAAGYRFESLLAVDKDSASLDVYIDNFSPRQAFGLEIEKLLCGNLMDATHSCEKELLKGLKPVSILLAGPPCQGHSNLNNHTRRDDNRNKLYERVARFAELAGPRHILIENVPTVIHGRDRSLDRTIERLLGLKYKLDAGIVNLADFGVPQNRKRHVLIASLEKDVSIKELVKKYRVVKARSLRWAIEDIEQAGDSLFDRPAGISQENVTRINYLIENDIHNLPNHLRPICHQNDEHSYYSMYGRMRYDEPSQTITSGFSSPGQGRYIHPARPRTLTPHEAARLQFFPDFFDFSRVKYRSSLARMIGNAVPMKLSYVVGLELLF